MDPLIINPKLTEALVGATVTEAGLDGMGDLHIVLSNGAVLILPPATLHVIGPLPEPR